VRHILSSFRNTRTLAVFGGLLLAFCIGSSFSRPAVAQANSSDDRAVESSESKAASSDAAKSESSNDEQAEFKHSGSVRLVAKITGLGLDNAYWLCVLLNFAVVAGAILWASKKYLPAMFKNRTASIQQAMAEARKTSEEANRRLADIEARLSNLGKEIEEMRVAAENEAAAEEARTKAAAIEDARRIVESAEQEIAAAARTARRDLTAYAADLAVSLARKQIHVDAGTDQDLIRSFARQLSDPNPGKTRGSS
jgi:F0F1-type ATP synthase membrane subunit b/b'